MNTLIKMLIVPLSFVLIVGQASAQSKESCEQQAELVEAIAKDRDGGLSAEYMVQMLVYSGGFKEDNARAIVEIVYGTFSDLPPKEIWERYMAICMSTPA